MRGFCGHLVPWTLLSLSALCVSSSSLGETSVKVPGVGAVRSNVLLHGVTESLNIPFAEPPVGKNRFRPTQPWAGSTQSDINGTAYGPICIQQGLPGIDLPPMSEDCLQLNIWTPSTSGRLPVFVFIHGGAFTAGAARQYNGSELAAQGTVVVTNNYRIGVFGWLPLEEISKENPDAPGNGAVHGFLDQLQALHWVQAHISAFGGDPAQVTIGGESAGALSVCAHMHLPAAQGLFSRVVIESGSCVGPWGSWSSSTEGKAKDLFMLSVGAFSLSALREASVSKLVNSTFWPAISPSPDGWWLQKMPADLPILSSKVEVLIGSNTMDSLFGPPWDSNLPAPLGTVFKLLVPTTRLGYEARVWSYFGSEGLSLYPAPKNGAPDDYRKAFIQLNADVCNTCPKHWMAQKLLRANTTVFAYSFGFWPNSTGVWNDMACHGCEMDYVFKSKLGEVLGGYAGRYTDAYYDDGLADAMSGYWTSFVGSGRPHGDVAWPEYRGDLNETRVLKFRSDSGGKPVITPDEPFELRQCEFLARFWQASAQNKDRVDEFCTLPAPRLSASAIVV